MTKIKIVADSSADLTKLSGIEFASAPLVIVTADKKYVDDKALDVREMVDELYHYNGKSSTSCPNASDWLNAFGDAEEIFCLTITSALSGSYNSACVAKKQYEEKYPDRKVEVIDSRSAGPEIALVAEKIRDMAAEGKDFEQIKCEIAEYKTDLLFVLESMKNLANNGRVSKIAATAAGFLGIRAVGKASDEGTLAPLAKCRGAVKAVEAVVDYMKRYGYKGQKARICHCFNVSFAAELEKRIRTAFPTAEISIAECRGLCSFYAEKGGILIGFEI